MKLSKLLFFFLFLFEIGISHTETLNFLEDLNYNEDEDVHHSSDEIILIKE